MKDLNGTTIKTGDKVHCNGLEFIIESFQTIGKDNPACGTYGCLNTDLLELVEKGKNNEKINNNTYYIVYFGWV